MDKSIFVNLRHKAIDLYTLSQNVVNSGDKLDNIQYKAIVPIINDVRLNIEKMYYTEPMRVWNYDEAPPEYQFKVEGNPVYVIVYEKEYFEKHGTKYLNTPTDKIKTVFKFDTDDEVILIGVSV